MPRLSALNSISENKWSVIPDREVETAAATLNARPCLQYVKRIKLSPPPAMITGRLAKDA